MMFYLLLQLSAYFVKFLRFSTTALYNTHIKFHTPEQNIMTI